MTERMIHPVPSFDSAVLELRMGRVLSRGGHTVRESADEILDRVSNTLGEVERRHGASAAGARAWAGKFRALMSENRFWPSGRILNNCGARQSQLASCFVLPISDDFAAVFDTVKVAAACHRTGGGTGFDFSRLRERGTGISSAEAGGASGPVSWLRLFDAETAVVSQGGKMRGANLASLSIRHPDIMEFVDAKRTVGRLSTFNLSVMVDDESMERVIADEDMELVSPLGQAVRRRVPATEIWQRICENAWRTGDPGLLFHDAINRANPLLDHLGPITTTNPCGEQTLYPYEASNLGSLNLAAFLLPDRSGVDTPRLRETVATAVRLLDNAIDASVYPDPRIQEFATANRRLGLGVMGYGDLLVHLGIPYDSPAAMDLVDEIGSLLHEVGWQTSRGLGEERGPFTNARYLGTTARHVAVTTIAPTGTISMIARCSSGIEPRFAPVWTKDVLFEEGVTHADEQLVRELCGRLALTREAALELLLSTPVDRLPLPAEVRAVHRYAREIPGEWHVRAVARWQRYIDNAVSKTVNLPHDCTVEDVSAVFLEAWRGGCKGVSVYREGSRELDLIGAGATSTSDLERQSKRLTMAGPAVPEGGRG